MTDPTNRLIAAALAQAGHAVAREQENGRLVWKRGSHRCYGLQEDDCAVVTMTRAGNAVLRYEVVGVTLADLV